MTDSFSLIATLFFFFEIIILIFLWQRTIVYFYLYKKKKNPDYPILPGEAAKYLFKGPKAFFKIYMTPFFMWKIIFEKNQDKELNNAAKQIRFLLLLFICAGILAPILIILTTPNLNFRWG